MRFLTYSTLFLMITLFGTNQISYAACSSTGPNIFVCNSLEPNPDPVGVQQGGNNSGVQVDALPGGNIDTNNISAIDLGNGENRVNIDSASIFGQDRAINLGTEADTVTLHSANLESEESNIFFGAGNDNLVIEDSNLTTTVGGVTISVGPGNDTAMITGTTVIAGPNISRLFTGGAGDENVTITNSVFINESSDVTVSLGADDDKIFVSHSTITNATDDFPLRGAVGDDEITLGTGVIVPGGVDCDFDNEPQGFDTLIFAMEVPASQIADLTELIENSPTPDGSITINKIDYLYRNCDVLIADLRTIEPIPTLSEWGLIAMAGVLGLVSLLAIRRRKPAA